MRQRPTRPAVSRKRAFSNVFCSWMEPWVDLVLMVAFRPVRKRARSTSGKRLGAIRLPPNDAAAA